MHHTKFNDLIHKIKADKDWFDDMLVLRNNYDTGNGGNLHIVLADFNINDESVIWCAGYACGKDDEAGNDLANLMRHMTKPQRKKLVMAL